MSELEVIDVGLPHTWIFSKRLALDVDRLPQNHDNGGEGQTCKKFACFFDPTSDFSIISEKNPTKFKLAKHKLQAVH